ncbi:hypothetical protein BV20DRAFT_1074530 [Pilatotrama ljubarskyi]|nr:hypothetical protein BV20DRAFT_1074530 [Pilatotrama ljubarskyi]
MHNLFLGVLRHHCRDVWGIDIKDKPAGPGPTPHTPAEQEEWLARLVSALRHGVLSDGTIAKGALSAVSQPRKGYLVALAQVNGITPDSKLTKQAYAAALLKWVQTHSIDMLVIPPVLDKPTNDFHLARNEYDLRKFRILTPDIIRVLRSDMASTYLPSWIERPPANFGSPSHGKLKADHWRTICTINMVITLVRVWTSSTAAAGDRRVLENFIHLAIAVDLATRRSMDPERVRLFDFHMAEYLRTLLELFDHDLVPNHHLALHLSACLLLFGPVRGWWGYPFERFNGIIQRLNTNHHIAEIPLTFMRLFCSGSELRWMMSSTVWPDSAEFREVVDALKKLYQDHTHGSRVHDIFGPFASPSSAEDRRYEEMYTNLRKSSLDDQQYARFVDLITTLSPGIFTAYNADLSDGRSRLSRKIRILPNLQVGRVTYGARADQIRNSFVCFKDPTSAEPELVRAGQISRIFLHSTHRGTIRCLRGPELLLHRGLRGLHLGVVVVVVVDDHGGFVGGRLAGHGSGLWSRGKYSDFEFSADFCSVRP